MEFKSLFINKLKKDESLHVKENNDKEGHSQYSMPEPVIQVVFHYILLGY